MPPLLPLPVDGAKVSSPVASTQPSNVDDEFVAFAAVKLSGKGIPMPLLPVGAKVSVAELGGKGIPIVPGAGAGTVVAGVDAAIVGKAVARVGASVVATTGAVWGGVVAMVVGDAESSTVPSVQFLSRKIPSPKMPSGSQGAVVTLVAAFVAAMLLVGAAVVEAEESAVVPETFEGEDGCSKELEFAGDGSEVLLAVRTGADTLSVPIGSPVPSFNVSFVGGSSIGGMLLELSDWVTVGAASSEFPRTTTTTTAAIAPKMSRQTMPARM
jgi:hypothetical protein